MSSLKHPLAEIGSSAYDKYTLLASVSTPVFAKESAKGAKLTSGFQSKSFAEPPSYIVVEYTPRANRRLGLLVASLESKPTSGIQR